MDVYVNGLNKIYIGNTRVHLEISPTTEVQVNHAQNQMELLDGARGIIRIPKIDLEMLIFEEANGTSLRKEVGMIEPEKRFGINNIGLVGHCAITYSKQFNRLDELVPNDEIEIKTKTGTYEFVVVQTFVVDCSEVEVLTDKKKPFLTLVTCTPTGKKNPKDRLIVQAKLVHKS